ncbi:MAG: DUF86 domain-containing protein [Gammaproteobacteria bacterium]|nr:DUF86 domain-containing protein [Gammaproteobacteria bacterium]MCP5201663.1 DUF86 domain-containing protein [Gammaproteobacteria bacterium]
MVDADILRRKTAQVLHHAARLEHRAELDAATLASDEDLANAVLMDIQQAIQGCIDLAAHACADDDLGAPANAAEAFALIARAGLIDTALATRLTAAAGLRNLIVHQYASLDYARVLDAARAGLADLRALVAALAADAH